VIRSTTVKTHHASSQQPSDIYTRPILHSVLAIKMGQVPAESYLTAAVGTFNFGIRHSGISLHCLESDSIIEGEKVWSGRPRSSLLPFLLCRGLGSRFNLMVWRWPKEGDRKATAGLSSCPLSTLQLQTLVLHANADR